MLTKRALYLNILALVSARTMIVRMREPVSNHPVVTNTSADVPQAMRERNVKNSSQLALLETHMSSLPVLTSAVELTSP